jgi:hypothetical protein
MKFPEQFRIINGPMSSHRGDDFGMFLIPGPCGRDLRIIASNGDDEIDWEHVSVSLQNRCPNWEEMCYVKGLFWSEEETVMQLHPPKSQWINFHQFCLHMWRPKHISIPLPPAKTLMPIR